MIVIQHKLKNMQKNISLFEQKIHFLRNIFCTIVLFGFPIFQANTEAQNFDPHTYPQIMSLSNDVNEFGEYTISWGIISGAEEYQLEWLHVNNYKNPKTNANVDLPYDFNKNATRITTKEDHYNISSVFEQGYVLFRIRALGYIDAEKKQLIAGAWSCGNQCSGTSSSGFQPKIIISDSHSTGKLNWQYISNYAEEGKKKEVITYYDGTMRSQQAVTRLNTDNNIIVGETYYDHKGRAAVQAMPAPVVEVAQNETKSLRYYPDFNKVSNNKAFDRLAFDKEGEVACMLLADPMLSVSGTARYYSPGNPDQSDYNKFIPNAEGYPFSQTEYTADNTGRIKRQGGVGPDYQLGSGHETRYLYGTPTQDELNRLFASEAGYNTHYQKNAVIDANGQISVSYVDMYGRVVATALSGNPAEGMSRIESNEDAKEATLNILDSRPSGSGSFSLENTHFHTVTTAGPHTFNYELPDITFDAQGNLPTDVCLDCVYDLVIDIVDECGKRPALDDNKALPITKTIGALEYVCGSVKPAQEINFTFTTERLEVGTYAISRRLTVNKGALEANTIQFLEKHTNIEALDSIIAAEIAKADLDACSPPDCEESCLLALGAHPTYDSFMRCMSDCEYTSECEIAKDLMKSDYMPGVLQLDPTDRFEKAKQPDEKEQAAGGQYALYKINPDGTYAAGDDISIFNQGKLDAIYALFGDDYFKDRAGNVIEKYDIRSIVENFQENWAFQFSQEYHPEKCKLDACEQNESNGSLQYDYLVGITETYEEAYQLGLLNPLGLSGANIPPATDSQRDPFFKADGRGADYYNIMKQFIERDTIFDVIKNEEAMIGHDIYLSMWKKAIIMSGVCREYDGSTSISIGDLVSCLEMVNNYTLTPLENVDVCSRDRVWTFFRALYRARKDQIKVLTTPTCAEQVQNKKRKRFPEQNDLFTEEEQSVISSNGRDSVQIMNMQANAEAEMQGMCELQAQAQIDKIMEQLAACKINVDAISWTIEDEKYQQVREAFLDIMIYTCNMSNIFGSSDIPQELIAGKPDSIEYNSFDEALKGILGEGNINMDCNSDLISFPMKSSYEYNDFTAYKLLDACGCDKLLYSDSVYQTKKGSLPVSINNGRKYFEETYGFSIDNYQAKLCLCQKALGEPWYSGVEWDETAVSILATAKEKEYIPRGISCETCVDCEIIKEKFQHFSTNRGYLDVMYATILNHLFNQVAQDKISDVGFQNIIENYLNNELNQNKNYGEYQRYINGCYQLKQGDGYICSDLPDVKAKYLITTLENIKKDTVTNVCINDKNNVPLGAIILNNCQYYMQNNYSENDTTLVITIYNPEDPSNECTSKLRFLDILNRYDFNKIVYFNKNTIRRAPETYFNNNLFLIDVDVIYRGSIVTTTMLIEACFPVFICYDTYNEDDYELCSPPQDRHITEEEDCKENIILSAIRNAESIYKTLQDSIITEFHTDYSRQCLSMAGVEKLNMTFSDNEHHYTLYYYDQAGNLVRTIPPAGVEFVDASLYNQINEDRKNGNHTVFTKHRMETRYQYNSLNQLVSQYMPDHEAFENLYYDGKHSNLPSNLSIAASEFSGNGRGVLFGTLPGNNNQSIGYITEDGGASWQQINDIGIGNLNAVCANTNAVYVAGAGGRILKTDDGGVKWTILNSGTTENIAAIRMLNENTGYFFTRTGKVYKITNAGLNCNLQANAGLDLTSLEKVVYKNNLEAYAAGYKYNEGVVYKTDNGGESWLRETIVPADLLDVQMVNDQLAYALDKNGLLVKITQQNNTWKAEPVMTSEHVEFTKILPVSGKIIGERKTMEEGTDGYFSSSTNGGVNWNGSLGMTPASRAKDTYVADDVIYVLNDEGEIYYMPVNYTSWVKYTYNTFPAPYSMMDINAVAFVNHTEGYAGGDNGSIFKTVQDSQTGQISWEEITDAQLTENIKSIYLCPNSTIGKFNILTEDGILYTGNELANLAAINLSGELVEKASFNKNGKGSILTQTGGVWSNESGSWVKRTGMNGITALAVSPQSSNFGIAVADDGKIQVSSDAFATSATQTLSAKQLYSVAVNGNTTAAAGAAGTLIQRKATGNEWEILAVPFTDSFRNMAIPAENAVLLAGNSGVLRRHNDIEHSNTVPWQPVSYEDININAFDYNSSTGHYLIGTVSGVVRHNRMAVIHNYQLSNKAINAFAVNANDAWAVGNGGQIYKKTGINTNTQFISQSKNLLPGRVTAMCQTPQGKYFAVTQSGQIISSADGGDWNIPATSVTNKKLNSIRFFDETTGLAAGEGILLKTTTGGASWNEISTPQTFNDIHFINAQKAFLVGNNGVINVLNGDNLSSINHGITTQHLNSITFNGNLAFIAGNDGTLLRSENGGTTWTALKAPDNTGWVVYTDPVHNKNQHLTGIEVIDQRTIYAAGNGGVILKTIDGGDTWTRKASQTTADLTQISFNNTRNEAIISGTQTTLLRFTDLSDLISARFFYDRLGRLVASQNSKQQAMIPPRYSYTSYDALGRVVEVGEMAPNAALELTEEKLNATNFPNNITNQRYQITRTLYDKAISEIMKNLFANGQQNLRNRVASVIYQENYSPSNTVYKHATHYSYDIHGNVKELIQDNPALGDLSHRYKKMTYTYDLISGNVNFVSYQPGEADQWYHQYEYDADNRIINVKTGMDKDDLQEDAHYQYYKHGPLARTELGGANQIQGIDYAYTLQGWIKGVNANALSAANDMGNDGSSNGFAADVFGYSLHYNDNDYKSIGNSENFLSAVAAGSPMTNLYNGNIARMATAITEEIDNSSHLNLGTQVRDFSYDELNRLTASNKVSGNGGGDNAYATTYNYDANGNILNLTRKDGSGLQMDEFTYHYAKDGNGKFINNRLLHVNDAATESLETADLKDQDIAGMPYAQNNPYSQNYAYDEIGNLISDKQEEIAEIKWSVSGKVTDIIRTAGSDKANLHFRYDAMGNRVSKSVVPKNVADADTITTYYVRDAQGNVMAVYERKHFNSQADELFLAEQHLYGSSRLGMRQMNVLLANNTAVTNPDFSAASKSYELTNHLGNVLAVVSSERDVNDNVKVLSVSDYYPFGRISLMIIGMGLIRRKKKLKLRGRRVIIVQSFGCMMEDWGEGGI